MGSWTRSPASTLKCVEGRPDRPGARLVDFEDEGSARHRRPKEVAMEVIYPRCAGLDVHKQTVVACVRIAGDGAPVQQGRSFDTTTSGLLGLAVWLEAFGFQPVAREATGVYWKPVWHVLEGHFERVLANAAHVKNAPGR